MIEPRQISWIVTSLKHGLSASQLKFCFSHNICYNLLPSSKKPNSESMTLSSLLTYSKWNTNALKSTQNTELYLFYHLALFCWLPIQPRIACQQLFGLSDLSRFLAGMAYQSRKHQKWGFFCLVGFWQDSVFFWFCNKPVCFSHKISQMVIHTSRQAKIRGIFTSQQLMSQATRKKRNRLT